MLDRDPCTYAMSILTSFTCWQRMSIHKSARSPLLGQKLCMYFDIHPPAHASSKLHLNFTVLTSLA